MKIVNFLAIIVLALGLVSGQAGEASGQDRRDGASAETSAASLETAAAVTARASVSVEGDLVLLGDIFSNLPDELAVRAVAYSPAPGQRVAYDARWMYRMARAFNLQWRPMSTRQQVIVERLSQVISREEIEDVILVSLMEDGADADSEVVLSNRMLKVHVPSSATATVGVDDISFDPRTQRFSALISAPAGDPAGQKFRVAGRVHQILEVPVPTRRILPRDIIRERDVAYVRLRSDKVQRDTIVDKESLIGMSPKRGLREGFPVRTSDVRPPVLVKRNSTVTILLRQGGMTLTAQGKALEDGGKGNVIRVMNTRSNRPLEAEIVAAGRVQVALTSARQLALNN